MMDNMDRSRLIIILLFTIAFTVLGSLLPVLYATYVPANMVIQSHTFAAEDTTITSDSHYLCFDRTVHDASTAKTYTELYLIDTNGHRVEIESVTSDRYFQHGRDEVITPLDLPDNLAEGTYRYILVAEFNMADGRVKRTFAFKSDPFTVTDETNTETPSSPRDFC